MIRISPKDIVRFWSKVDRSDENGCWEWTAGLFADGYGGIRVNNIMCRAHRVSWMIANGAICDLHVLHKCDNPKCVRPDHLFLGTARDNMRDKTAKGRGKFPNIKGEQHKSSKLTESDVHEIRKRLASGCTHLAIANDYHISRVSVTNINLRKTWAHLPEQPATAA